VAEIGKPERAVVTTCAYCGVGCTFRAEMRGDQLVRMVPWKDGKANRGHSCVKGRFAWGYANHADRITRPMIREAITQPWREVSWDEAISFTANRLNDQGAIWRTGAGRDHVEPLHQRGSLVQKLVRGGFGSNNVDTCARVCHSPTGYGLKTTFGTSAGTQDFDSVEDSDVILIIGANPTDGHPVFASRMKKRLRQGAKLIVIDPRRIDMVRSPHIEAAHHLALQPGTNVAVLSALAHVIVTEGLADEAFIRERCDWDEYQDWARFVSDARHSPEALEPVTRVPAEELRAAARLFARAARLVVSQGGNGAIYYGLGVTEHSQGSSTVMAIANLAMATGNIGRRGVGVNPCAGRTMCRAPATWARSRMNCRAIATSPMQHTRLVRGRMGRDARSRTGPAHSQHAGRGGRWFVPRDLYSGRGHSPVRPQHASCGRRPGGDGMRDRA
jgi:formate dehydrogenase major subunit